MADQQSSPEQTPPPAPPAGDGGGAPQAQFGIRKVYLKDLSFEAPNTPAVFTEALKPQVELHFQNRSTALSPDHYEVVLTVTATVKADGRDVYLAEVQQAGVFQIVGVPNEQMPAVLATACPNTLLPFAREAIADVVTKGGFPQLLIAPVNFEVLYLQELQRRQQQAAAPQPQAH